MDADYLERIKNIKAKKQKNDEMQNSNVSINKFASSVAGFFLGLAPFASGANITDQTPQDNELKGKTTFVVNTPSSQAEKDDSTYYVDGLESSADDHSESQIKEDTTSTSKQIKHYLHIEEVPSLDAIYNSHRPAGKYIDGVGIVYNQYRINNPTDAEQQLLDDINKNNYSASVADHEKTHALMADVRDKLYDGTLFMKVSDRVRAEILAELICFKEGDKKSAEETIEYFKKKHLDGYTRNYDTNWGSIVLAKSAEEIIPETTYEIFERSGNDWQNVSIDSTSYCIWPHTSEDGKYKTTVLYKTAGDKPVVSPDILAKSPVEIGVLYNADGSAVLSPDGQKVHTFYSKWYGGEKYVLGGIPNTKNKVQGYSYTKAQQNYQTYLNELWNSIDGKTSVTKKDFQTFQTFVNGLDLSNLDLDMSDKKVQKIRNDYQNITLEQAQQDLKKRRQTIKDKKIQEIEESINKVTTTWVEVADPSAQQVVQKENTQEKASNVSSEKTSKAKKGFAKMFQKKEKSR